MFPHTCVALCLVRLHSFVSGSVDKVFVLKTMRTGRRAFADLAQRTKLNGSRHYAARSTRRRHTVAARGSLTHSTSPSSPLAAGGKVHTVNTAGTMGSLLSPMSENDGATLARINSELMHAVTALNDRLGRLETTLTSGAGAGTPTANRVVSPLARASRDADHGDGSGDAKEEASGHSQGESPPPTKKTMSKTLLKGYASASVLLGEALGGAS